MRSVEGWKETSLGDQLELIRNGYSGEQVAHFTDFPVSRIETISEGTISFDKVGYVDSIPEAYLLRPGDILFSNINSIKHIGKVAQVDQGMRLFHGMNLLVLRPLEQVDKKFLFYKLVNAKPWFEKMAAQAINQASINQTTVRQLLLELPRRKLEQAKIAGVLSTVDRAIEQTEALIAKQERIKTGLMQDLFTRGIDEHGNIRSEETHQFKDSPLGGIPVEWEVTTLGTAVGRNKGSVQTGPFGSQLHAEDYRETGVPIITVEHLSQNRILHRNLPLVGEEDYRRLVKYTLCEGDLVFSRVGAIDRCSYVSKDENGWLFSGRCFRVRSGQEINSRYLSYQLNHDKARNWILNNSVGTTMACLNTSILSMTPVLLPQQKEQAQVARLLDFISDAIQYELLRKAKLNSLKTGLMQDLLTGKIRVTSLLDNMEVTNR